MNCQRSFKSEPFRSGDFRLLEKRKWHDGAIERKHHNTWGFMKYIESRRESKRYCCFYIFLAPNKANAALCFLLFTRTLEAHQKVVILPISVGSYLLRLCKKASLLKAVFLGLSFQSWGGYIQKISATGQKWERDGTQAL